MESDVKYGQTSPTSNTGSGLPCVTVQKKKRLYIQDLKRILMRSARGVLLLLLLLLVAVKALGLFKCETKPNTYTL
ncbi:hypothetical protein CesoFtcFv8_027463 [Champsocephalus esox]|uniref:Uncharacterized protein n=1 Tax=Champsocephalus esox TaxID=159716 RepID=A0AAN7Y306_9TELE|nr:hypothetical protein CesoFtcFv8_027463 [Champsocephalus esox]